MPDLHEVDAVASEPQAQDVHVPGPMPLGLALVVTVLSSLLLVLAFPSELVPVGMWAVALLAPLGVLAALRGRRVGGAALVGFVACLAFYLPHISWMTEFLRVPGAEWVPWLALTCFLGLFWGAGGVLIALAYRVLAPSRRSALVRLVLLPVVVAGLWTGREALISVWPYGGFAWGRIGLSQGTGPLKELYSWLGVSGMTFLCVLVAALVLAIIEEGQRAGRRAAVRPAVGFAAFLIVLGIVPAWPTVDEGTIRVAAVQGNGKTAYFDPPARAGDNLLAQVQATVPAFDEDVDVIVWPEGGSDLDPLRVPQAARIFDDVAERAGAPIVSGVITARVPESGDPQADTEYFNTAIVWRAGEGAGDYYDKRHPVPFGEYVPDRAFFRQLAPDLIDLIQREYTPGTTDAVLELDGGVLAGAAICFDIVDDQLMHDIASQGGSIVLAPTNNADFGQSIESAQQLEIARVRALEMGRTVVNISTVGTSAIILADGSELERLPRFEPGAIIADVPLSTAITPAMAVGRWIEWAVAALGLLGLVWGALSTGRARRG